MISYLKKKSSEASDNDVRFGIKNEINSIPIRLYLGTGLLIGSFVSRRFWSCEATSTFLFFLGLCLFVHAASLINLQNYLERENKLSEIMEATKSKKLVFQQVFAIFVFVVIAVAVIALRPS